MEGKISQKKVKTIRKYLQKRDVFVFNHTAEIHVLNFLLQSITIFADIFVMIIIS